MSVRLFGKSWVVDFHFGGERCRKRSPLNTKAGALAYEMFLRKEAGLHGSITAALRANAPAHGTPCPTLIEFAPRWFKGYVVVNNRPQEQRKKNHLFKNHILPYFGHLRLCDIGPEEIEQYKGIKRETPFGAKTINDHLAVLHKCLVCAKEWKVLRTEVPRMPLLRFSEPAFRFLCVEDCRKLLAASTPLTRAMIMTGLQTGMRFCELSALRWQDVDLDRGIITIAQSRVGKHISPPKNNRIRHMPLTRELAATLSSFPREAAFVFHRDGLPISYSSAWKSLRKASREAGVEDTSWHDLRHTFASQLVSLGASLLSVQHLLGHSSIQVTMRYSHLGKDALRDSVRLLDAVSY
jgi:integrase